MLEQQQRRVTKKFHFRTAMYCCRLWIHSHTNPLNSIKFVPQSRQGVNCEEWTRCANETKNGTDECSEQPKWINDVNSREPRVIHLERGFWTLHSHVVMLLCVISSSNELPWTAQYYDKRNIEDVIPPTLNVEDFVRFAPSKRIFCALLGSVDWRKFEKLEINNNFTWQNWNEEHFHSIESLITLIWDV